MNSIYIDIASRILYFILGFSVIVILTLSTNKNFQDIQVRHILQILIIEIILGYFILQSKIGAEIIQKLCYLFNLLLSFASKGTNFVFGSTNLQKEETSIFFLNVLCPIIFISALIGVLQYSRILIYSIQIIGTILSKISGMGKLESFNIISSIILGQSENFILYKDIIKYISEPRIYTMAITAMSTVSLSMISVYMTILNAKYVIAALILNIFSTIIIVSLINPYTVTSDQDLYTPKFNTKNCNFFEIIVDYILIGFKIATTVAAMLIGFIALIETFNMVFKFLFNISLQEVLGYVFFPFSWILGVPTHEIFQVSSIMATKLISNEFIAMIDLQKSFNKLSSQSIGVLSVFLVSFSNFTSIGIIIGSIKTLDTEKSALLANNGIKLLYSSTLINLLSAMITRLVI